MPSVRDVLVERRVEGDHDVCRRRVPPLCRLHHVRPLVVQIERQRRRVAGTLLECAAADQDEAHARRAFDALARRRDHGVEGGDPRVDRQRAERAHRVEDEAPAVPLHHGRDFRQRVEDAGRRLAMDEPDVGNRRIGLEQPVDVLRRRRHVLGRLEGRDLAAHHLRESGEPRAVGAVDQHQHVAVARNQRVHRRLDRERATPIVGSAGSRPQTPMELTRLQDLCRMLEREKSNGNGP